MAVVLKIAFRAPWELWWREGWGHDGILTLLPLADLERGTSSSTRTCASHSLHTSPPLLLDRWSRHPGLRAPGGGWGGGWGWWRVVGTVKWKHPPPLVLKKGPTVFLPAVLQCTFSCWRVGESRRCIHLSVIVLEFPLWSGGSESQPCRDATSIPGLMGFWLGTPYAWGWPTKENKTNKRVINVDLEKRGYLFWNGWGVCDQPGS